MSEGMEWPNVDDVARDLLAVVEEVDGWCDVRLQVYPDGGWDVRWGDSSYDLDHRGYWGASSVHGAPEPYTLEQCTEVAQDLLEQAKDAAADDGIAVE